MYAIYLFRFLRFFKYIKLFFKVHKRRFNSNLHIEYNIDIRLFVFWGYCDFYSLCLWLQAIGAAIIGKANKAFDLSCVMIKMTVHSSYF